MKYELPKLNYAYQALEPAIDARNYGNPLYKTSQRLCHKSKCGIGKTSNA